MHMLLVKFRSGLSHDEALRVMDERLPQFRAVPGLVQKYYAREAATGEYVGVYFFDSEASLEEYRSSGLARSIPEAYHVEGSPRREALDVLLVLRPDATPGAIVTSALRKP